MRLMSGKPILGSPEDEDDQGAVKLNKFGMPITAVPVATPAIEASPASVPMIAETAASVETLPPVEEYVSPFLRLIHLDIYITLPGTYEMNDFISSGLTLHSYRYTQPRLIV